MNGLKTKAFLKKTRSAPTVKRAETPKDRDDDRNKKAKSSYVKPNSTRISASETNVRRDESSEDEEYYKAKLPQTETKQLFVNLDRLKATSERFKEKMAVGDEDNFTTIESFDSPVSKPTKSNSEDSQWDIIQIPHTTTNCPINIKNLENNELDANNVTANDARSDSKNQKGNECLTTDNHQQNLIPSNKFYVPSSETLTEHGMNDNASVADSIANDSRSDSRNQQDNGCFPIDNSEESDKLSETNLDDEDLEEIDSGMNASEILMEEIESQRFPAEPSTAVENDVGGLACEGNNTDILQDKASTWSETQNNNTHWSVHYLELVERIKRTNASRVYPDSKRCSHPYRNGDLRRVAIKVNRNRSNNSTRKYYVTSAKSSSKSSRNQQKELQGFIMSTMRETHPGLYLKDEIAMKLQIFLWDMLQRIGDEAENLVMLSSRKVFDNRVLKYAIKLSLEAMKKETDVVCGKRNQWLF